MSPSDFSFFPSIVTMGTIALPSLPCMLEAHRSIQIFAPLVSSVYLFLLMVSSTEAAVQASVPFPSTYYLTLGWEAN